MDDSMPLQLSLPELKYPIGSEPKEKVSINQYSTSAYISVVEGILSLNEMTRIRQSSLGPVLKLGDRDIKLSGKIVYAILARSIVTIKENEAWFHFGAQPMRFSIREFHMVSGLRCSGEEEGPPGQPERYQWEFLKARRHTLDDVVKQLRSTRREASDERVCLAMLLLVESILLRKSGTASYPVEYVKYAQDIRYPWGREAYKVLLKSLKKAVDSHLENTSKFEVQGCPLIFHLWILESIPMLQKQFSRRIAPRDVPGPVFLCEHYTVAYQPALEQVLQIEGEPKLKVKCILPPIPNDPEDDVYMEDKYSAEVESLKDISKKGYKYTAEDWINRYVNTLDTLDALVEMLGKEDSSQSSASIEEDSVDTKLNRVIKLMEENMKIMKDRMLLVEKENKKLKARVSELEGSVNVAPQTNVTLQKDTQPLSGTPVSPMSQQQGTQVFSPNVTIENDTEPWSGTTPISQQPGTQIFSPNVTREETMNESPASPKSQEVETQMQHTEREHSVDIEKQKETVPPNPNQVEESLNRQVETEPSDDTPALDTQVFTTNLSQQKETETSTFETPSNTNQEAVETDDDIVRETLSNKSPAAQTQDFQKETEAMNEKPASRLAQQNVETPLLTPIQTHQIVRETLSNESPAAQTQDLQKETEAMNETPASRLAQQNMETPLLTPIQTHHMVTEGTYDATEPLTEIISANNKKEDTHVVHNTPPSPISSLISLVLEQNKNALSETETATQYFSVGEREPSNEMPYEQNEAEKNLQDTIEPTTEIISTDVSKTQPLTQQTQHLLTSDADFSETEKAEENKLPTLFENGARVEITSSDDTTCRIWYPGNVVATNLCDGIETVTVECSTMIAGQKRVTVTADKIRPIPPPDDREKGFEMMDNVEVFYSQGWGSGQVKMVLGEETFSVYLNSSMETLQLKASDLRVHREWIDGEWKIADEIPAGYFKEVIETQNQNASEDHVAEDKPNKKRKAAGSSKGPGMDNVFLRRSEREPKRSKDTKTPFKADRNPALTVTPEIIPALDPFSTPAVQTLSRFQKWKSLKTDEIHGTSISINGKTRGKNFFHHMEKEKSDLNREEIETAFAMLNCRRDNNAPWFHNYKIPKACFLPMDFLHSLLLHDVVYQRKQAKGEKVFNDLLKELVKGHVYPKKKWGKDVDVVYGVTRGKKSNHWIGMAIHLKNRTITLFDCLETETEDIDIPQVQQLAVLISALLSESFGGDINKKKLMQFGVEKAPGLPKTKFPYHCGLFLVKILECHSLKMRDMSKINDGNAGELRRSLSCDIFNQFVDAN